MAGELPGMNVLQVLAAAPFDLLNLGAKQLTEFLSVANAGVTKLGTELMVPPAGLPQLPMGLPQLPDLSALLPGMGGMAGGASAQSVISEAARVTRKPPRLII